MLRKHEHEPEPQATGIPEQPSAAASLERRMEEYLDEVCTAFCRDLPQEKTGEIRAEMRAHLEERVAAHLELGDTREEAIAHTLQQFGRPKQVGRAWQRERAAGDLTGAFSGRKAARTAFALFAPTCLLGLFLIQVETTIILGMAAGYVSPQTSQIVELLAYATAFLMPVPAGLLTGILARARPVRTAFRTLCLLSVPMIGIQACRPAFGQSHVQGGLAMLLFLGLFWIPIGCVSAGIGGWLRKHTTRCRQRLVLR